LPRSLFFPYTPRFRSERLHLTYGDSASFSIVSNFPSGVAATIALPAPDTAAAGAAAPSVPPPVPPPVPPVPPVVSASAPDSPARSEEHTSELQSRENL